MSTFVTHYIAVIICCFIRLAHAPKIGMHVANEASFCEIFLEQSSTCYLQRNVGDRVDLQIALSGVALAPPISWYRRLKILDSSPMLVNLKDTGHLPRNMELSPDGHRLTIHQLREYDMSGNGIKAWLHGWLQTSQSRSFVNFVIEPLPIDLGDPVLGDPISINIEDYVALPDVALYVFWHKEGAAPEIEPYKSCLNEGGGHFKIDHLSEEDYGIYVSEIYSDEDYFIAKKKFQIGDVSTDTYLHESTEHPPEEEESSANLPHHKEIMRHYEEQQPQWPDGKVPVSVQVANPDICSYHHPSSHLCIITIPMMLLGKCDLWLEVIITGTYNIDDVVWLKHYAKLNREQTHSDQFEVEELSLWVSDDGRSLGIMCGDDDFMDNYFSVQVRNGNQPTPSFTFKLIQEPIELGHLVLGQPYVFNTFYYGIYPLPSWISKWVHEDTGNFTVVDPPRITHEYRVESLGIHDIGFLSFFIYEGQNGYQVATRRFHSEAAIDTYLHESIEHPPEEEESSANLLHHKEIMGHYEEQQPQLPDEKSTGPVPVSVQVANPDICSYHLPSSHLCIITIPMMLLGECDLSLEVNITGTYSIAEVVWLKHYAKLNREQIYSDQFEVEELSLWVSDGGRKLGIICGDGDFMENYFSVQVRNGNRPTPSFTFKLIQEPIELGPLVLGQPYKFNTFYYGIYPLPSWISKWVHEDTGNFTVVDPPRITHEYSVESLGIHDIGLLSFFIYEGQNGYQVATRRFHSEADIDECSTGLHDCPEVVSYCGNTPGSYVCICTQGFTGDGWNCIDINECSDPLRHSCDVNADCVNTPGSYYCTCLLGYHGSGLTCTAVECPLLTDLINGRVARQGHSFGDFVTLACNDGHRMEGSGVLTCLEMGFWSSNMPSCHDINECEAINECSVNADCTNTPGSYECDCVEGFEGNGFKCQDVDECMFAVSPCRKKETCTNVDHGYSCTCYHDIGEELEEGSEQCKGVPVIYTYEDILDAAETMSHSNVNDAYYGQEISHLKEDNADEGTHYETLRNSTAQDYYIHQGYAFDQSYSEKNGNGESEDLPPLVAGNDWTESDYSYQGDGFQQIDGEELIYGDYEGLPPLVTGNDRTKDSREGLHRGRRENYSVEEYVYAQEETSYRLPCLPASMDKADMVDIEYRWVAEDDKPLTSDRYLVLEDGELEIVGVVPQDSGVLMCEVYYGGINSGTVEMEVFEYFMMVFTLPHISTSMSVKYHINACEDDYNNNIWQEIVHTALKLEVCQDAFCEIQEFDTECHNVQEVRKQTGVDLRHELVFTTKIVASNEGVRQCSITCMVGQLYSRIELIIGKLQRYTDTQNGQLASYPSVGFSVVEGSLQNQLELACDAGHGLHEDICVACEPGAFSPADAVDCRQCGRGSYEPDYAASSCEPCPSGHYSYHPGATKDTQCHGKIVLISVLIGMGLAGLIGLLGLVFVTSKIVKKHRIKSHGVRLPGLDLGEGVDLLANMHEVDYRRPHGKSDSRWRKANTMPMIPEEHVSLHADLPYSSDEASDSYTDEESSSDEDNPQVILQMGADNRNVLQSRVLTEMKIQPDAGDKVHSAKELRHPSQIPETSLDQINYATLDHSRSSPSYKNLAYTSKSHHTRRKMGSEKSSSYQKQNFEISSETTDSSSTSSSTNPSSISSTTDFLKNVSASSNKSFQRQRSSPEEQMWEKRTSASAASYVNETTMKHKPIFPSEPLPSEIPRSHTHLMLDSPQVRTVLLASPSIRQSSSKQSFTSSLPVSPRSSVHFTPPSDQLSTGLVSKKSQQQVSPQASSITRHIGSVESIRSHAKSPVVMKYASSESGPTQRTPTMSHSTSIQVQKSNFNSPPPSLGAPEVPIGPSSSDALLTDNNGQRTDTNLPLVGSPVIPSGPSPSSTTPPPPAPPPSQPLPSSSGKEALSSNNNRRRDDNVSENVLAGLYSSPGSRRGTMLSDINEQRTDENVPSATSPAVTPSHPPAPPPPLPSSSEKGALLSINNNRRRDDYVSKGLPAGPCSSLRRGAMLSNCHRQRTDEYLPYVASPAVTSGPLSPTVLKLPPPTSPVRLSSFERVACMSDINKQRRDEYVSEGVPSAKSPTITAPPPPSVLLCSSERRTLLSNDDTRRRDDYVSEDFLARPSTGRCTMLIIGQRADECVPSAGSPALNSDHLPPNAPSRSPALSSSSGRRTLLSNNNNLRIDDYVSEGVPPAGSLTITSNPQPSTACMFPSPTSQALPSSSGRGSLLNNSNNRRKDAPEDLLTSSCRRGTLLSDIHGQKMNENVPYIGSHSITVYPVPSTASRHPPSTSQALLSSFGRGVCLSGTNNQRKDDYTSEGVTSAESVAITPGLSPRTAAMLPPPASPALLNSSGKGALSDVNNQKRSNYMLEGLPSGGCLTTTAGPVCKNGLLSPPSMGPSPTAPPPTAPSSVRRWASLNNIHVQRCDYFIDEILSSRQPHVLTTLVDKRGTPSPSSKDLSTRILPTSPKNGALLDDIQKPVLNDCVTVTDENFAANSQRLPPFTLTPSPAVTIAESSLTTYLSGSPGRQALQRDIEKMRMDNCVIGDTMAKLDHGDDSDWFSCESDPETRST